MPQKRNPYALVVIRGGARTLLGRATGVLATQLTPSGRTDNLLYAYGEVAGRGRAGHPPARPRRRHRGLADVRPRSRCRPGALATDEAERLSLDTGLDYRSAYTRVGRAIAAGELPRRDAREAIATRTVTGGAAPAPLDAMLQECRTALAAAREGIASDRARIAAAEETLLAIAQ